MEPIGSCGPGWVDSATRPSRRSPSRRSPTACSEPCPGGTLVVSSSMPVRDVEAFGSPRADPPRVLANRGANGIDGVVSTALGVALATGPTVALVGDLAFLHDVSALVGSAEDREALTVVVADNGGGGIFSFLPQAARLATRALRAPVRHAPSRPIRRRWPGDSDGMSWRSTVQDGPGPSTRQSPRPRADGWWWSACPTEGRMWPYTTRSTPPSSKRSTRHGWAAPTHRTRYYAWRCYVMRSTLCRWPPADRRASAGPTTHPS